MNILGLSNEHDSGAVFLEKGDIIYAANEERFSRKKFTRKLPGAAIEFGKKTGKNFFSKIDLVAIGSKVHVSEEVVDGTSLNFLFKALNLTGLERFFFGTNPGVKVLIGVMRLLDIPRRRAMKKLMRSYGVSAPIEYVDHHLSHASSAYFTAPWEKCLVVTLDAQGDGACSRVYAGENGSLTEIHSIPFFHTPGYYYWCVTLILGFKQGREGKVTGLAARGDYEKTLRIFEERISFDQKKCSFVNHGYYKREEYWYLKERLKGFSREDVAAGVQKHLENLVTAYVKELVRRCNGGEPANLALAGGVFANVTLNKKIMELPEVSGIYIYPHMGDGGLAAGAALTLEARIRNLPARNASHSDAGGESRSLMPKSLENLYLGPSIEISNFQFPIYNQFPNGKIEKINNESQLAQRAAKLLASGKTVAVARGRMEYGPRALGNRSILHQATDPAVNDWLNKRLKRNEFMPFAPIIKKEYLPEYFVGWEKCEKALEYMTIALDATDKCKNETPAIVHVDGTARPQVVTREINPFIYELLGEYEKLTGKRILINTSFNMHEEPIVCSQEDAIRAFRESELGVLILGDNIIEV